MKTWGRENGTLLYHQLDPWQIEKKMTRGRGFENLLE